MHDLITLKEELVRFSHRLYDANHVVALDGNLSFRYNDTVVITPTMCCKKDVTVENLVTIGLDGALLSAGKPSSEVQLHLMIYRFFPHVSSVCHAHPFYTTLMSIKNQRLQPELLIEAEMHLSHIGYVPDTAPGSKALVEASESVLQPDSSALVISRHGSVTWGEHIAQAYYQTESLERLAKTCFYQLM